VTTTQVIWHGDKFLKRVERAQKLAIDETTAAASLVAQADLYPGHGLITGLLQGSVKSEQAQREGARIVGRWGSFDVIYAIFIEIRYGFLRKAAEAEYPKLMGRIKDWLK
jgi:hypothetical protein